MHFSLISYFIHTLILNMLLQSVINKDSGSKSNNSVSKKSVSFSSRIDSQKSRLVSVSATIAVSCTRVSVNTSAPSAHRRPVFVDCHSCRLGIGRQCTHSLHRNDMAYCHFELCRDCGLGCFSEMLLADIRRLLVVAVVFLYQITFVTTKHNSITFGTLF